MARPPMWCSAASSTWRLGGVEHERDAGLGGEAAGDLVHVGGAVAADVVDAHVEHVGALADLVAGHLHARVPVGGQHRVAEGLRPVGVGALADDQERAVLVDRHRRVDRRHRRLDDGLAARPARDRGTPRSRRRCGPAWCRSSRPRPARRSSVTKRAWCSARSAGREVVVGVAVHDRRQPGVGQHRDRHRAVPATGTGCARSSPAGRWRS